MTTSRSTKPKWWRPGRAGLLGMVLLLLLPACATSGRTGGEWAPGLSRANFDKLGVHQVKPGASSDYIVVLPSGRLAVMSPSGSAVFLGNGVFVTCRHVLPLNTATVELDNGEQRAIRVLASGLFDLTDIRSGAEDWMVFEIVPSGDDEFAVENPPLVDFERKLEIGQDIFLVGFCDALLPAGIHTGGGMRPMIAVNGQVRRPPALLPPAPPGQVCVETSSKHVFDGMSGGAAVVWDTEAQRLVVVGIYRGMFQWSFLGLPLKGVETVVRPKLPPEVSARLNLTGT